MPRCRQGSALQSCGCILHRAYLLTKGKLSHLRLEGPFCRSRDSAARDRLFDRSHLDGGVPGVLILPTPCCELAPLLPEGGGGVPGVPTLPALGCELAPVLPEGGGGVPGVPI